MQNGVATVEKQRKIGVMLSYIHLVIGTFISIAYTPYMIKKLGQSEYGIYQLVGSLSSYLSLLSMGLSGAYINFYTKCKTEDGESGVKKLNSMYLAMFSMISCLAMVCGLILTVNLEFFFSSTMTAHEIAIGRGMMLLMTANVAISLPMTVFSSYIAANEKFIFQRAIRLLFGILSPVSCVIILGMGGRATEIVLVTLVITVVTMLFEVSYCIKILKFQIAKTRFDLTGFKQIFGFSFFILLNDIINVVNWHVDKVLLGAIAGAVAIAIYGLASQLNSYFLQISVAISSVYAPSVYRIVMSDEHEEEKNKQLSDLFTAVGRIQSFFVFVVIIGYVIFGHDFIRIWAGDDYSESYYVGLWLMIPVVVPLIQNLGIEIQRARNKHRVRTLVYMGIAVLNVIISIPLCMRYGANGCAIGTAIALVVGNIIFMNWYYWKQLKINIIHFWRSIITLVPALTVATVGGLVVRKYINIYNYPTLGLGLLIYVLIYFVSIYAIGMNGTEKNTIKRFLKKVRLN